jgi:methylmalonyl-CoA mutase C-terminal domain
MEKKRIRVLMSKIGVDGHWRGVVTVSRGLMNAGMEVVFGGAQTAAEVVNTAIEEDVDVVGLSIHSGAHIAWTKRVVQLLKEKGADNILVIVGGAIPRVDYGELKEVGAVEAFGPGSSTQAVADFIKSEVDKLPSRGSF